MAQADGTILIDTHIETGEVKAGSKEIESAVRRMAGRVDELGNNVKASVEKSVAAITKQNVLYAQQARKVSELQKAVEKYANQEIPTDEYSALSQVLDDSQKKLTRLLEVQERFEASGGDKSSQSYKSRKIQIDELTASIKNARLEMKQLEDAGEAFTVGNNTEAAQKAMENLRAENAKLNAMGKGLQSSFDDLYTSISRYTNEMGQAVQYIGFLQSTLNGLKMAAQSPISMFKALGQALKSLPVNAVRAGVSLVKTAFDKLATSVKKALSTLVKFAGNKIVSGLKKISAGILGIHKNANKSSMSLGQMLKTGLLMSVAFQALSGAVSAMKEGFTNLAQYSSSTNSSISMLWSSLERLKNSLATAFAPILDVVAPILSRFIDMLSTAASYVSMFFSMLTGKSTYTRAVAVQKDYAASLADTASGAQDAADATNAAAEAAEGYLSPLDEINKLDKNDTSSGGSPGGSGGGAGGTTPDSMFETVEIEPISFDSWGEAFNAFLDYLLNTGVPALRNALSNIANVVNAFSANLYEMFTFPGVLEKVRLLGQEIAGAFNDFVNMIDWQMLGAALGSGLNLAIQFMVNLVYTFDWLNLGASIATMINSAIAEIDWYAFGQLLWSKFKIAIETLAGFLLNLDMTQLAHAASNIVMGFFNSITETIQNIDWQQLGEQVATFLANIDWGGVATAVFTAIGSAFGAAASFLWGLIKEAWNNVVNWWKETAFEDGKFTITGLLEGIVDVIASIGSWIKEHIFQPFIDGFKSVFGINSPSTVMIEMGKYLMEGLFNGISSLIDKVISIFGTIRDKISEIWNKIKSTASNVWNGIKTTITNIWNGIKNSASSVFDAIKSKITNVWNSIKSVTSSIWNGIKNTIKNVINGIIGGINGMIRGVVNGLNTVIRALNRIHFNIPDWVPVFGGRSFGFSLSTISAPQIPYLASGAVIPPNQEFLAVLGDQKQGTNIEAPESLIRKIMREELAKQNSGGGSYAFTAQINRRTLFEEFIKEAQLQQMRTGKNPLDFA